MAWTPYKGRSKYYLHQSHTNYACSFQVITFISSSAKSFCHLGSVYGCQWFLKTIHMVVFQAKSFFVVVFLLFRRQSSLFLIIFFPLQLASNIISVTGGQNSGYTFYYLQSDLPPILMSFLFFKLSSVNSLASWSWMHHQVLCWEFKHV